MPYFFSCILISPFMMFDVATKTTDIIMFNSRNLDALIVDEKPHVKSWDEPQYSIHNLGIEESYGFGVLNEGQAIAVAKNVKVRQNEMSTPARPIISIGPDNANFQAPSGLVGVTPFDVNNDNFDLATVGFVSWLLSESSSAPRCRVEIRCRISPLGPPDR